MAISKKLIFSILLALIPMSAQAVALSPSVTEISAQRGQTIEQKLTVINTGAIEQTYFLGVLKFEAQENGESPTFIPFETDHLGLPQWITFPFSEFRVPANSKGEVPYTITVPTDVQSGGYYAAITVSQSPSELVSSNGAIVEAKTAALILLTVEGSTVERLELLDFLSSKSTRADLSGDFSFRVQNQGNVHVQPQGVIRLKTIFGRTLIEADANPQHARILPGSTRMFEVTIPKENGLIGLLKKQMTLFAIGPITAELDLKYGVDESIVSKNSFWYIPWQLLLTAAISLIILIKLFTKSKKHMNPHP